VRSVRANNVDLAKADVTVDGGEHVDLVVDYTRDCTPIETATPENLGAEVRVVVETIVGLERTLSVVDGFALLGIACN
jgi:hypothetical protein